MSRRILLLALCSLLGTTSLSRAVDQRIINAAVEKGVAALKQLQGPDGTWRHAKIGATALAGLTLLECNVPANDPAITKAANAVRQASVRLTHTYSIALAILFFDRLGDPADIPLIESLTVRLLAGQNFMGGWGYDCPPIGQAEVVRLTTILRQRNELRAGKELPRPGQKRTVKDLPKEIQQQLLLINRLGGAGQRGRAGDNSNTQFAVVGLWAARRHGLPVNQALARVDLRFRKYQGPDGGWGYSIPFNPGGPPGMMREPSSAAMTCAGLLGLAVNYGANAARRNVDMKKDRSLRAGLLALSTVIGVPAPANGVNVGIDRLGPGGPMRLDRDRNGTAYYFLWSLERVAVALDLKTIEKKDWYAWGSQILLANQQFDGSWQGNYAGSGADTCFALLFLRRANLTTDLTARLKGKVEDPAEVTLKTGGVGGNALSRPTKKIRSALDADAKIENGLGKKPKGDKLPTLPSKIADDDVSRLSAELVEATGVTRDRLLKKLKDSKGGTYTSALAMSIPLLDGADKKEARQALAERLTRMTSGTLKKYLAHTDPELRRASALAVAMRDIKAMTPDLIEMLGDPEPSVVRAVYAGLKAMTDKDFGPDSDASPADRARAIKAWRAWWKSK